MRALSLGYHDVVANSGRPDQTRLGSSLYTLDVSCFQAHLQSIVQFRQQAHVRTVDRLETWRSEIPVFLTFDDGGLGSYTYVADELEKLNWRGHFFIATDWIGRPGFVNGAQIRELKSR